MDALLGGNRWIRFLSGRYDRADTVSLGVAWLRNMILPPLQGVFVRNIKPRLKPAEAWAMLSWPFRPRKFPSGCASLFLC